MTETGKNYRKGDPLRGAAILLLSCELRGVSDQTARDLIQGTIRDLGVKEAQVRDYLTKHRDELMTIVAGQAKAEA